jgi:hypothetical protein
MPSCPCLHTCMPSLAPLAHKQALALLRLSKAAIQTNMQLDVAYTRRWCTRGCNEATDTEHHLLFECPALADARAAFTTTSCTWQMVT